MTAPAPADAPRRLVEVVQRLSLCRDVPAIAAELREAARELTGADGVTVILREGEYCHYVEENAIAPLWKGKRFPLYSCISGTSMRTREQIAVEDVYADERVPHDLYRPTFVKSLVVTPIRTLDPLGAIGAYWARPHRATAGELETLRALGDAAAIAFENASLIQSLGDASRRKDEFLVMLAHELRNPLAPVLNAVHVLRAAGGLGGRGAWALDVIERQAGHLARVTDDLLDSARIASGKVRLERAPLDLASLARELVADRRSIASGAGLSLEAAIPEMPVWVEADSTRLSQVISNLLDNALKFTPPPGRIELRVEIEGSEAVLAVSDSGIGIEPEFLPHVFESFAQADKSLDRARGGLGLGLTIARSLAQAHGGSLEAHSDGAGRGTRFVLRLPRIAEPPAVATGPRARAGAEGSSLRVLVVEDNADAADSLKMLLELVGHSVAVSRSGSAGLAEAKRSPPDVMLCDIGLPGLDGYQVARELRSDPRTAEVRLIAFTGYGGEDARAQAFAAGFDEHLVKPVLPEALLAALQPARA